MGNEVIYVINEFFYMIFDFLHVLTHDGFINRQVASHGELS